jgi:hypothetical protein
MNLTDYERHLLNELMNVNWEIEQNKENKILVKYLSIAYDKIQSDLMEEMGEAEYYQFIRIGQRMFS